jgi:hypothetical protein
MTLGQRQPEMVVVDIRPFILNYEFDENFFCLYRHVDIRMLIESSLTTSQYLDDGEYFWSILEAAFRSAGVVDEVDFTKIGILVDQFQYDLDRHLSIHNIFGIDIGNYVFYKWVDGFSLIMKYYSPHDFKSKPNRL